MATYSPYLINRDHALLYALGLSLTIHLLLAFLVPRIEIKPEPPEPVLTINLAEPQQAEPLHSEPSPVVPQEPSKPEQPPPEIKKPEPKTTPTLKPKPQPSPSPVVESAAPSTEPEAKPAEAKPAAPAVIATETKAETQPVLTTPPPAPEPPKPVGPSQQDIDGARNQYGNTLAKEIAKHKQYPKIAQMRGWEGEVIIDLNLDGNGNVLAIKIKQSSNYEQLDKQALEMVKKASPFPLPPNTLRGREFNVTVPIPFRLE